MRDEPIAGRYELVEQLDAGGMEQVWRGYDAVLDREVADILARLRLHPDPRDIQAQVARRRHIPDIP